MLCSILENYVFTCILILVYHKEPMLAIIYEGVSAYYCSEFCSVLVIVLSMFVQPFHMFLFVLPLYKLCFFFFFNVIFFLYDLTFPLCVLTKHCIDVVVINLYICNCTDICFVTTA